MKRRILAVLLAVCMIAGTGVLFASADDDITFTKNSYVQNGSDAKPISWNITKLSDLHSASQTDATLKPKGSGAQLSSMLVENPDNFTYDDLIKIADFSVDSAVYNEAYEIVMPPTITRNTDDPSKGKVVVSVRVTSDKKVYQVSSSKDLVGKADYYPQQSDFKNNGNAVAMYMVNGKNTDNITVSNVKLVEQLHGLTMGLQFYGDKSYTNISASEVAQIESRYTLLKYNPATKKVEENGLPIVSHVNSIYDLYEGQSVRLEAKLKDGYDNGDYGFKCWVDSSNNIISRTAVFGNDRTKYHDVWVAGVDPSPIYAVFEELKSRVRVNYSWEGEGAIAYQESTSNDKVITRALLNKTDGQHTDNNTTINYGQISILQGHTLTFVFTPKEGYEVAHVYVDRRGNGNKIDVASFKSIILNDGFGPSLAALKELISATGANRSFTIEADKDRQEAVYYKFTFTGDDTTLEPDQIRSIHVVFEKKEVYKAPEGKELPTVEPEGITLATGATPENAEGANGGTTLPAEGGSAGGSGATPLSGSVVNPATGSGSGTGAITVFTVLSLAAGAALVTTKKKKED